MEYRFERDKDKRWASYESQKLRYDTIKRFLGKDSVGAEIGVYRGGFGEFLRHHCKMLYLVDPWHLHKVHWNDDPSPENSAVRALQNILEVYRDEMEAGRVVVVPNFSTRFLKTLPDGHLDWAYLDSSHAYKATTQEIDLCLRKIRPGGFLIGDDYMKEGVQRAVTEACKRLGRSLTLVEANQWVMEV